MMRWVLAMIAAGALGCATTTTVPPQDHQNPPAGGAAEAPGAPTDPEAAPVAPQDPAAAAAKAWQAAGALGEHHTHLEAFVGEWKATARFWSAPKAPALESEGTSTNRLILGGRFLEFDFAGIVPMGAASHPFIGLGLLGYDNLERWHTSLWMDSLSTSMMVLHGVCDDDGRRITLMGGYNDAITGERRTSRTVYRVEGTDRYVIEVYMPDAEGNEYRAMEIVHERAK